MKQHTEKKPHVFVMFGSPFLYGAERSMIEKFSLIKPDVDSVFLMTYTSKRLNLPNLRAVNEAGLEYEFMSDKRDWPRLGKPKSTKHILDMVKALFLGNLDVLKVSRNSNIIYIPSVFALFYCFLAILKFRFQQKRVVVAFHEIPDTKFNFFYYLFDPLVTDYLHFSEYSAHCTDFLSKSMKNSVVRNVTTLRANHQTMLSLPSQECILNIGQIRRSKGIIELIHAFEIISEKYPHLTLDLVGANIEASISDEFFKKVSASDRINYHGYLDNPHHLLVNCKIFVQPTLPSLYHESFGRGAVEAMAAGIPVICFKSGALPEHVIHEETGLVCEEENVECLAQAIDRLLSDRELYERCSQNAKARYEQFYSPDVLREMTIQFFTGTK